MQMPNAYICDNVTQSGASWEMMKEACKYLLPIHQSKQSRRDSPVCPIRNQDRYRARSRLLPFPICHRQFRVQWRARYSPTQRLYRYY
nr:MAG TPA: hypothetical protein [Bacteriophage sp.]